MNFIYGAKCLCVVASVLATKKIYDECLKTASRSRLNYALCSSDTKALENRRKIPV